jgi:hypothetical protein
LVRKAFLFLPGSGRKAALSIEYLRRSFGVLAGKSPKSVAFAPIKHG